MSEVPTLLERLNLANTYADLQDIFADIAALAQSGGDHAALARSIDEAIRRLESERARDEAELHEIQTRYESFRADNKGLMGWFKRHLPFSETRRQDVVQREQLTEQTAEVLADNLVIARAQMVKERCVSAADRKLGARPTEWQQRLEAFAAGNALREWGESLQSLAAENEHSSTFLEAVQHDIEAFASATLKSADDRKRRGPDLVAARQERAELLHEVEAKHVLKQASLKQIATRAVIELNAHDAAFVEDRRQLERWSLVQAKVSEARSTLGKLIAAAATIGKLAKELKALPGEIQQGIDELRRIENQCADANLACNKKAAVVDEHRGRVETAQREAEQARQLLASAQQFYDAYQAECRARQRSPATAEAPLADPSSPMLLRFNEAQANAQAAQARLREVSAGWESAKKEVDTVQAGVQQLKKQLDTLRDQQRERERKGPQLRAELSTAIERTQRAFAIAATGLGAYLTSERGSILAPFRPQELAAGMFGGLSLHGLESSVAEMLAQAERDYQRHLQASQLLDRVGQWLVAQQQTIEHEQAAANSRRTAAWLRRCTELVGDVLAKEACAGGLSE